MFNQIVILDHSRFQEWAILKLQKYSKEEVRIYNGLQSESELIEAIQDADAVFLSWTTSLNRKILSTNKSLKYIGLCCSLYDEISSNVDLRYAKNNGIVVRGIKDYGDEGLIEYIVSELIRLLKGLGESQWREDPVELTDRKIGIIGLGTTGLMLANTLQLFKADLYYFSRTRKPEAEAAGIKYLPKDELLKAVDIISIHLPRRSTILEASDFKTFGNGKILINTSLGLTFDKTAFEVWIKGPGNYAILDGDGVGKSLEEWAKVKNIISTKVVSGWTVEAKTRLCRKVIDNMLQFLDVETKQDIVST